MISLLLPSNLNVFIFYLFVLLKISLLLCSLISHHTVRAKKRVQR